MTIKFDQETIMNISLFENITSVPVKDCITDEEMICFVVEQGKAKIVIRKNGRTINHVQKLLKKMVKVFEWSDNLDGFVKNLIPQAKNVRIDQGEKTIITVNVDKIDRAAVIGRRGKNIQKVKEILKRHYNVDDVRLPQ
jgi:N utilization substance protein A